MNAHRIACAVLASTSFDGSWPLPVFFRDRVSSAQIRHDPSRPKSPSDLEALEAARLKRARRLAKKGAL